MMGMAANDQLSVVFAALADPSRRAILAELHAERRHCDRTHSAAADLDAGRCHGTSRCSRPPL